MVLIIETEVGTKKENGMTHSYRACIHINVKYTKINLRVFYSLLRMQQGLR